MTITDSELSSMNDVPPLLGVHPLVDVVGRVLLQMREVGFEPSDTRIVEELFDASPECLTFCKQELLAAKLGASTKKALHNSKHLCHHVGDIPLGTEIGC